MNKNYQLIKNIKKKINIFKNNSIKYFKFFSYHQIPDEILDSKIKKKKNN